MPSFPCNGYPSITAGVRELRALGLETSDIATRLGCTERQVLGGDDTARRLIGGAKRARGAIAPFRLADLLPDDAELRVGVQRAATRRGVGVERLLRRIIETVVDDGMIDAVLDDGDEKRLASGDTLSRGRR